MDNEYEDAFCPECDSEEMTPFGFCPECGFDYEEWLKKTDELWELHHGSDE